MFFKFNIDIFEPGLRPHIWLNYVSDVDYFLCEFSACMSRSYVIACIPVGMISLWLMLDAHFCIFQPSSYIKHNLNLYIKSGIKFDNGKCNQKVSIVVSYGRADDKKLLFFIKFIYSAFTS